MTKYPGPFHKFVGAQKEIYPQHRKLQDKCGEKAKGYGVYPHIYSVTDQTELGIPSGPEHTGNQRSVNCRTHNVVGVDKKHIFQIMHGSLVQRCKSQDKGRDCKNDQTADSPCDYRQAKHSGSISFGFFQVSLSHDLSQQNGSCACNGKTEYRADISHHYYQGIGGNCVCAKVS